MASSASSTPPPWIILGRVAHVLYDHGAAPSDLSLLLVEPPHFSALILPLTFHPRPSRDEADRHPYVVAANEAGLLLHVSGSPFVGFNLGYYPQGVLIVVRARDIRPAAATAGRAAATCSTAVRLPGQRPLQRYTIKNLGLLPLPGGEYVVAELIVGGFLHLLTFRSDSGEWCKII
ncbi:hypothetical protein ACP70R_027321 [Stipagrostis hirtigluma subsp. patula]